MRRAALGGLALSVALSVALTGCGTTVQVAGSPSRAGDGFAATLVPDDQQPDAGAAPRDGASTPSAPDAPAAPGPRDGTTLLPGPRPVGPGAPAATGAPSGAARIPARHKGVSGGTVKLGFLYLASAGTVVGAFGIQGYSQGDELGVARALVADQNRRGGLAGRSIELVPRDLGGIDEASYQAACAFFTQDQPVFMVLSALGHSAVLNSCLAKGDVGYTSNYIAPSDRLMRSLGPVYAPDDLSLERYALLLGRSLPQSGVLPRGAKVGIVREDSSDYERVTAQVLRPLLVGAGVEVVAEETYSATDAAAAAGDAGGLAFRLRAAGATHVLSYSSPLLYMTAAESQGWRPFWVLTSRSGPGSFLEGAAPQEQLRRSGGPGWQPVSDIASARLKGFINSEERRCLETLRAAGYDYAGTPRYVAQMICGELFHVARTVGLATELSTTGFRTAAESLPSYPSPMTFGLSFAGGRHDGASAYRIVQWQSSCSCFGYTTPIRPIPTN